MPALNGALSKTCRDDAGTVLQAELTLTDTVTVSW